jgi:hypothetical protein
VYLCLARQLSVRPRGRRLRLRIERLLRIVTDAPDLAVLRPSDPPSMYQWMYTVSSPALSGASLPRLAVSWFH